MSEKIRLVADEELDEDFDEEEHGEWESFAHWVEQFLSQDGRFKDTNMDDPNQSELYWMTQDDVHEEDFDTLIKLFGEYFEKETNGRTYTINMGSRNSWRPDDIWVCKVRYTHGKPEILKDSRDYKDVDPKMVYVVFTQDPDPNVTHWHQKGVFKDKKSAIEKAKRLEAKGFSVFVSEEYKGDDYGDGETVYDSEVDFFKENPVEESFKSKDKYSVFDDDEDDYDEEELDEDFKSNSMKDKYSVLREALDKLDREYNKDKEKRMRTRAQIRNLRSRLK